MGFGAEADEGGDWRMLGRYVTYCTFPTQSTSILRDLEPRLVIYDVYQLRCPQTLC